MTENNNQAPAPAPAPTPAPASPSPSPAPGQEPSPSPSPAPSLYKPEGLPDHLVGTNDQETIDKLYGAVQGFRKDLSKKGVPEKAEGYELKLTDELKEKILRPGADGKDPMLEKAKGIFHKHNIPNSAFQDIVMEVYQAAAEMAGGGNGDLDSAADFEYKNLGGKEKAKAMIDGAEVWINGLVQNSKISESTAKELKLMSTHGEGLSALIELRGMTGAAPIPKDFEGDSQEEITKEILDSRVADPRYWTDPAFQAETTKMFQKFYDPKK